MRIASKIVIWVIAFCLLFSMNAPHVNAATLYVANNGNDSGDCSDGNTPCKTITYAVSKARVGDNIIVKAGLYDYASGERFPITINMNLTFRAEGDARIDATGSNYSNNAIIIISYKATVNINSFTIKGSANSGLEYNNGSSGMIENNTIINNGCGIATSGSRPTILNNKIQMNTKGICNRNSNPLINKNIIIENSEYGIYNYNYSNPEITDNTISSNKKYGIYNVNSNPSISKNHIIDNQYGIYNENSSPTIARNIIASNDGAGISNDSSNATIKNNTIVKNGDGIENDNSSSPTIGNNIIASNGRWGISAKNFSNPKVENNDVYSNGTANYGEGIVDQTGFNGNISQDPFFVESTDPNFVKDEYLIYCDSPLENPKIVPEMVNIGVHERGKCIERPKENSIPIFALYLIIIWIFIWKSQKNRE